MFTYFVIILTIILIYFNFISKRDPRLPPGPTAWPIIGTIPFTNVGFLEEIRRYRKKYGDILFLKLGSRDVVILSHPEIIKRAFNTTPLIYRPYDLYSIDRSSGSIGKAGIIYNDGQSWQSHRRFVLHHLRDSGFGKSVVEDIVHMEAEKLLDDIKNNFLNQPVQPLLAINIATVNVIWKIAADVSFTRKDTDVVKVLENITRVFSLVQGGFVTLIDMFPWLIHIIPNFVYDKVGLKELKEVRFALGTYYRNIVKKHKESLDKDHPLGLIDSYLLEMEKESSKDLFNELNLTFSIGDLFFAGTDTTGTTLKWALLYMARYPEIQEKLQKEIDGVVPKNRLPGISDRPNLPCTEAALYEVLRLTSLFPFGVPHAAGEDTVLDNYFIPKGAIVLPFQYGCHTDERFWDRPDDFHLEHFLDSSGNFTSKNDAFMPFSTGKRLCLGESLARTELFIFLSSLLQKFTFRFPNGETPSVAGDPKKFLFRTVPKLDIIIQERNS